MQRYPGIRLSRLREIGWSMWNPLNLDLPDQQAWRHVNIAEYDNHLLHVACLLSKGGTQRDAVAYLEDAAVAYPCPSLSSEERHQAAIGTAQAVEAYLRETGKTGD